MLSFILIKCIDQFTLETLRLCIIYQVPQNYGPFLLNQLFDLVRLIDSVVDE